MVMYKLKYYSLIDLLYMLDLVIAISKAIHMFKFGKVDPSKFNNEIKDMYNWSNVAERTEKVYLTISQTKSSPLIERLRRYYGCGLYAGKIFCMVMALDYLIWMFLEWLFPSDTIEKAKPFPYQKYRQFIYDTSNRSNSTMNELSQSSVEEDYK